MLAIFCSFFVTLVHTPRAPGRIQNSHSLTEKQSRIHHEKRPTRREKGIDFIWNTERVASYIPNRNRIRTNVKKNLKLKFLLKKKK